MALRAWVAAPVAERAIATSAACLDSLWDGDYRPLDDNREYLGVGKLTLYWRSDKNEDAFLQWATDVLSSKYENTADLTLHCPDLPLDARFLKLISERRPRLRTLDLHCWTYCRHPRTGHSGLKNLTDLRRVDVSICDATAFPLALQHLAEALPPLQELHLTNRGAGHPVLDAASLPRFETLYLQGARITKRGWGASGEVYSW